MKIPYEQARRLFREANDWTTGQQPYISEDSELRQLAKETFQKDTITTLMHVCTEIFRVIAEATFEDFARQRPALRHPEPGESTRRL